MTELWEYLDKRENLHKNGHAMVQTMDGLEDDVRLRSGIRVEARIREIHVIKQWLANNGFPRKANDETSD